MIVLMYFYLVKFRSPYNPEHLTGQGFTENEQGQKEAYFWTDKNSDDFLKYIKREIFEVAYLLASTIMTFEVMQYGHLWTEEKKRLPFVQKSICLLLNAERLIAILLKLSYLHKYLSYTREHRRR
jgi:fumarate reductase subunit C